MIKPLFTLTALSALGCAVSGGVLFAFSTFVMRALGKLPPAQGIAAMQAINLEAVSPAFMIVLFGSGASCVFSSLSTAQRWSDPITLCQLAATVSYVVGCIGVTMVFNVPRNARLAVLSPTSLEAKQLWARYLVEWTTFNHVRTVASVAAAALLILSLVMRDGAAPGDRPQGIGP